MPQNSYNRPSNTPSPSCAVRPTETFFWVHEPLPLAVLEKAADQEARKIREGLILKK